jgi:hypothetical protein
MTEIEYDPEAVQDTRPTIAELLNDPGVRTAVKIVLRDWTKRDPVDAAFDAGLLAAAMERMADERCGRPFLPCPRQAENARCRGE